MLKIPDASEFGGKGDIPATDHADDWLNGMKNNGCIGCHQLGQLATRTIPKALGEVPVGRGSWMRRVRPGQAGEQMVNQLCAVSSAACRSNTSADWTDRIAKGELPHSKPPRPQGVERNVVVTTWDWADRKHICTT